MSGIYFGLFVAAVLLVIRWCMTNEQNGTDGAAGLLAMSARRQKSEPKTKHTASRFRRKEKDR
jgi:hypothetical protein